MSYIGMPCREEKNPSNATVVPKATELMMSCNLAKFLTTLAATLHPAAINRIMCTAIYRCCMAGLDITVADWTVWGSNPSEGVKFSLQSLLYNGYWVCFWR